MKYSVNTSAKFDKAFKELDKYTKIIIKSWIEKNLVNCEDPRQHGKSLKGNLSDYCCYRIGDYRLICLIEDNILIITAINIGHRKDIYK